MAIDTQSSPPVHGGGAGADRTADEILDSLALALLVAGPDGSIRDRNATAAARLPAGRDLDTAFGLARFAEPFDGWSREIQRVLRTGASVRYTCVFPGSNERPAVSATVRCTPLLSQSGEAAAGVVILVEEATEQDMLERQLEVSQRLAALGKLAARVAHELNNPLDGILRYVNLAMRLAGEFSEPRLQSYLAESRTGLMRMVGIIGDLLQFSRSTDGEFDEVSINEVVERAIQATAPAAEAGRVIGRTDDDKVVVHDILAASAVSVGHKGILASASVHQQHVSVAVHAELQRLTGAYRHHVHLDAVRGFKVGQDGGQQARVLGAGCSCQDQSLFLYIARGWLLRGRGLFGFCRLHTNCGLRLGDVRGLGLLAGAH